MVVLVLGLFLIPKEVKTLAPDSSLRKDKKVVLEVIYGQGKRSKCSSSHKHSTTCRRQRAQ